MNIADHAITATESPALIIADDDTISFGELYTRSQRVAALLHRAGLRRGDGVALVLPNRPEFFEITWGCQLSGLYYTVLLASTLRSTLLLQRRLPAMRRVPGPQL